jgi:hypothetical protein
MTKLAAALLAFATLTTGCAAMGTKRSGGAQIQRTQETSAPSAHDGDVQLGERADLGQR